jgi:hypothetical protein
LPPPSQLGVSPEPEERAAVTIIFRELDANPVQAELLRLAHRVELAADDQDARPPRGDRGGPLPSGCEIVGQRASPSHLFSRRLAGSREWRYGWGRNNSTPRAVPTVVLTVTIPRGKAQLFVLPEAEADDVA